MGHVWLYGQYEVYRTVMRLDGISLTKENEAVSIVSKIFGILLTMETTTMMLHLQGLQV